MSSQTSLLKMLLSKSPPGFVPPSGQQSGELNRTGVFLQYVMIATVFLLAYLPDSLIIMSSDRMFQFLFSLNHLFNLFLKKQGPIFLSALLFLFSLGQSVAHTPLQHCQSPPEITSAALLHCNFSQTGWISNPYRKNLKYLGSSMMLHCTHHATKQTLSGYFRVPVDRNIELPLLGQLQITGSQYLGGMQDFSVELQCQSIIQH